MKTPPTNIAQFDLWWTGQKADPDCPSCHGTGWAVISKDGIALGGGRCVCRGGTVDVGGQPPPDDP